MNNNDSDSEISESCSITDTDTSSIDKSKILNNTNRELPVTLQMRTRQFTLRHKGISRNKAMKSTTPVYNIIRKTNMPTGTYGNLQKKNQVSIFDTPCTVSSVATTNSTSNSLVTSTATLTLPSALIITKAPPPKIMAPLRPPTSSVTLTTISSAITTSVTHTATISVAASAALSVTAIASTSVTPDVNIRNTAITTVATTTAATSAAVTTTNSTITTSVTTSSIAKTTTAITITTAPSIFANKTTTTSSSNSNTSSNNNITSIKVVHSVKLPPHTLLVPKVTENTPVKIAHLPTVEVNQREISNEDIILNESSDTFGKIESVTTLSEEQFQKGDITFALEDQNSNSDTQNQSSVSVNSTEEKGSSSGDKKGKGNMSVSKIVSLLNRKICELKSGGPGIGFSTGNESIHLLQWPVMKTLFRDKSIQLWYAPGSGSRLIITSTLNRPYTGYVNLNEIPPQDYGMLPPLASDLLDKKDLAERISNPDVYALLHFDGKHVELIGIISKKKALEEGCVASTSQSSKRIQFMASDFNQIPNLNNNLKQLNSENVIKKVLDSEVPSPSQQSQINIGAKCLSQLPSVPDLLCTEDIEFPKNCDTLHKMTVKKRKASEANDVEDCLKLADNDINLSNSPEAKIRKCKAVLHSTKVVLVTENESIPIPLPSCVVESRWYVLNVNKVFDLMYISSKKCTVKYKHILESVTVSMQHNKTVRLPLMNESIESDLKEDQIHQPKFGVYSVPNVFSYVFIGPYGLNEESCIVFYKIANGRMLSLAEEEHNVDASTVAPKLDSRNANLRKTPDLNAILAKLCAESAARNTGAHKATWLYTTCDKKASGDSTDADVKFSKEILKGGILEKQSGSLEGHSEIEDVISYERRDRSRRKQVLEPRNSQMIPSKKDSQKVTNHNDNTPVKDLPELNEKLLNVECESSDLLKVLGKSSDLSYFSALLENKEIVIDGSNESSSRSIFAKKMVNTVFSNTNSGSNRSRSNSFSNASSNCWSQEVLETTKTGTMHKNCGRRIILVNREEIVDPKLSSTLVQGKTSTPSSVGLTEPSKVTAVAAKKSAYRPILPKGEIAFSCTAKLLPTLSFLGYVPVHFMESGELYITHPITNTRVVFYGLQSLQFWLNKLVRATILFMPRQIGLSWSLKDSNSENVVKRFDSRILSGNYILTRKGVFDIDEMVATQSDNYGLRPIDVLRLQDSKCRRDLELGFHLLKRELKKSGHKEFATKGKLLTMALATIRLFEKLSKEREQEIMKLKQVKEASLANLYSLMKGPSEAQKNEIESALQVLTNKRSPKRQMDSEERFESSNFSMSRYCGTNSNIFGKEFESDLEEYISEYEEEENEDSCEDMVVDTNPSEDENDRSPNKIEKPLLSSSSSSCGLNILSNSQNDDESVSISLVDASSQNESKAVISENADDITVTCVRSSQKPNLFESKHPTKQGGTITLPSPSILVKNSKPDVQKSSDLLSPTSVSNSIVLGSSSVTSTAGGKKLNTISDLQNTKRKFSEISEGPSAEIQLHRPKILKTLQPEPKQIHCNLIINDNQRTRLPKYKTIKIEGKDPQILKNTQAIISNNIIVDKKATPIQISKVGTDANQSTLYVNVVTTTNNTGKMNEAGPSKLGDKPIITSVQSIATTTRPGSSLKLVCNNLGKQMFVNGLHGRVPLILAKHCTASVSLASATLNKTQVITSVSNMSKTEIDLKKPSTSNTTSTRDTFVLGSADSNASKFLPTLVPIVDGKLKTQIQNEQQLAMQGNKNITVLPTLIPIIGGKTLMPVDLEGKTMPVYIPKRNKS